MKKLLIVAPLAAAALLAGCSGKDAPAMPAMNDSSAATPPTTAGQAAGQNAGQNANDLMFAQGMVAHDTQTLEMAKMASSRSTNAKVRDLAKRVEASKDPEIQKMNKWIKTWGASVSMPEMGPDPSSMSAGDMKMLEQGKGAAFDKMWLEMMIKHHQGAVDMATTELTKGSNSDAKKLAQEIVDTQQKEITEMQNLSKTA